MTGYSENKNEIKRLVYKVFSSIFFNDLLKMNRSTLPERLSLSLALMCFLLSYDSISQRFFGPLTRECPPPLFVCSAKFFSDSLLFKERAKSYPSFPFQINYTNYKTNRLFAWLRLDIAKFVFTFKCLLSLKFKSNQFALNSKVDSNLKAIQVSTPFKTLHIDVCLLPSFHRHRNSLAKVLLGSTER